MTVVIRRGRTIRALASRLRPSSVAVHDVYDVTLDTFDARPAGTASRQNHPSTSSQRISVVGTGPLRRSPR